MAFLQGQGEVKAMVATTVDVNTKGCCRRRWCYKRDRGAAGPRKSKHFTLGKRFKFASTMYQFKQNAQQIQWIHTCIHTVARVQPIFEPLPPGISIIHLKPPKYRSLQSQTERRLQRARTNPPPLFLLLSSFFSISLSSSLISAPKRIHNLDFSC